MIVGFQQPEQRQDVKDSKWIEFQKEGNDI